MAEVAMTEKTQEKTVDERPVVLKVDHVAKMFRLPTEQATGLKMAFLNWTKGIKGYAEQHVLRDINFEVQQGDFFGIVGRNGSGKSTLLKIISQIYTPEQGSVTVKGKLVPFIELGVGFNPELTGRENVYLNGALLGFTRTEIDAMYDDIVEFAELEDFMDQKLKNYSSGMQVRLAFSVAIKAQGDILVLDEVLAVGDEAFQRKCDNFFAEIKKDPTKTVILVTHSMDAVKKYCNKAILIKDGEIVASGDKNNVADRYTLENLKAENKEPKTEEQSAKKNNEPWIKVLPVSEPVCGKDDIFEFDIEYSFNDDVDFYFTRREAVLPSIQDLSCIASIIQAIIKSVSHCLLTFSIMVIFKLWLHFALMTPLIRRSPKPLHSPMEKTLALSQYVIQEMVITPCLIMIFYQSNAKA